MFRKKDIMKSFIELKNVKVLKLKKMYYSLIRTLAMRKYKKCENIAKVLSLLIKFYRKCLSL